MPETDTSVVDQSQAPIGSADAPVSIDPPVSESEAALDDDLSEASPDPVEDEPPIGDPIDVPDEVADAIAKAVYGNSIDWDSDSHDAAVARDNAIAEAKKFAAFFEAVRRV